LDKGLSKNKINSNSLLIMEDLLSLFSTKGILVHPKAIKYLKSKSAPLDFAKSLIEKVSKQQILTLEVVKKLEKDKEEKEGIQVSSANEKEKKVKVELPSPKPIGKEYESAIRILKDASKDSSLDSTLTGFSKLFRDRFDKLKQMLCKQHPQLRVSVPIERAKNLRAREIALIGIVNQVKQTSKGHKLIELEDETDLVNALVPKDNFPLLSQANLIIPDEVIGVVGKKSSNGNFLVINQILYPDLPFRRRKTAAPLPLGIAFAGDIHMGSKAFLGPQWGRFIRWLRGEIGNQKQMDLAESIKYLLLPGDLVEGIGVYPNQEAELEDCNLFSQYTRLAKELEKVPDWVKIIIQPGNHDAVRASEPQPALEGELAKLFSSLNCVLVGNPCLLSIEGVKVLSYHGQSLIDFAMNLPSFSQSDPLSVMRVMLRKRHLAPLWGGTTPLAPEAKDWMVIDEVPDIFVTGHVHVAEMDSYRGVTLINASAWQAQTPYQKGMNFIPDPAKVPLINLKDGRSALLNFNQAF
jgi:DNA polymerase II small subunit